eukprot:366416-Pyramimonas_sp.AAC.1
MAVQVLSIFVFGGGAQRAFAHALSFNASAVPGAYGFLHAGRGREPRGPPRPRAGAAPRNLPPDLRSEPVQAQDTF